MVRVRPLQVAAAAAVLLLVVLAADIAVNRRFVLDVAGDDGWRTVAVHPGGEPGRAPLLAPLDVDPNGTVSFRLRIENEYPWRYAADYRFLVGGILVAQGHVEVPPRDEATVVVDAPGSAFFQGGPLPDVRDRGLVHPYVEFQVGDAVLATTLAVREAGA